MTFDNHPTIPPPELVEDWAHKAQLLTGDDPVSFAELLCKKAARWGADQELEACCKKLEDIWDGDDAVTLSDFLRALRAARRPKPLSLKEQALALIDNLNRCDHLSIKDEVTLRAALNQLP